MHDCNRKNVFFNFFFIWLTFADVHYIYRYIFTPKLPLILLCRSYDEDDEALEEELEADLPADADAPARVHKVCYQASGFQQPATVATAL